MRKALIGMAVGIIALAGILIWRETIRSNSQSAPPQTLPRRSKEVSRTPVQEPEKEVQPRIVREEDPLPPAPTRREKESAQDTGLPRPPQAIARNARELWNWLKTMPDDRFRSLIGTSDMDRYVLRILGEFSDRKAGRETAMVEVDQFLTQINSRIESLQAAQAD